MARVMGVVLVAGVGICMGIFKVELEINGTCFLDYVVVVLKDVGCDFVIVVVCDAIFVINVL